LISSLLGDDFNYVGGDGNYYTGDTAWHSDGFHHVGKFLKVALYLDPVGRDTGCLRVIPGSHRSGFLYDQRPHNNPDEFDFAGESHGFDEKQQVPVEVKAGTVVFFNGYLLHRSFKNRSNIYRRVLVNHYMNAYSRLPWQVREGETPAAADRRNVVPVAGIDPYAWKGYETLPNSVGLRTCKANKDMTDPASDHRLKSMNKKS